MSEPSFALVAGTLVRQVDARAATALLAALAIALVAGMCARTDGRGKAGTTMTAILAALGGAAAGLCLPALLGGLGHPVCEPFAASATERAIAVVVAALVSAAIAVTLVSARSDRRERGERRLTTVAIVALLLSLRDPALLVSREMLLRESAVGLAVLDTDGTQSLRAAHGERGATFVRVGDELTAPAHIQFSRHASVHLRYLPRVDAWSAEQSMWVGEDASTAPAPTRWEIDGATGRLLTEEDVAAREELVFLLERGRPLVAAIAAFSLLALAARGRRRRPWLDRLRLASPAVLRDGALYTPLAVQLVVPRPTRDGDVLVLPAETAAEATAPRDPPAMYGVNGPVSASDAVTLGAYRIGAVGADRLVSPRVGSALLRRDARLRTLALLLFVLIVVPLLSGGLAGLLATLAAARGN